MPGIVAQLGLNRENFRTEAEATKRDLATLSANARDTAAAVALLDRSMRAAGGGSDAQRTILRGLQKEYRETQREIKATENQLRALASGGGINTGGGSGGLLSRIVGSAGSLGSSALGFLGIGSLSAGGILAYGKSLLNFAHETKIAADQSNLSVESFQRLRSFFGKRGADEEAFSHGMMHLSQSIAEARDGNVKAEQTFRDLGVSFADLHTLSPDQILLRIATAAKNSSDPTRTFADIISVLGKAGDEMIPGLKAGGDAIEEAGRKSKVASAEAVEAADKIWAAVGRFAKIKSAGVLELIYDTYVRTPAKEGAKQRRAGEKSPPMMVDGMPIENPAADAEAEDRPPGFGDLKEAERHMAMPKGPPGYKSALQLKEDELALESRLIATRAQGDAAALAAAKERRNAEEAILRDVEKNMAEGGGKTTLDWQKQRNALDAADAELLQAQVAAANARAAAETRKQVAQVNQALLPGRLDPQRVENASRNSAEVGNARLRAQEAEQTHRALVKAGLPSEAAEAHLQESLVAVAQAVNQAEKQQAAAHHQTELLALQVTHQQHLASLLGTRVAYEEKIAAALERGDKATAGQLREQQALATAAENAREARKTPEERRKEYEEGLRQRNAVGMFNPRANFTADDLSNREAPSFHTFDADRGESRIRDADKMGGTARDADKYGGRAFDVDRSRQGLPLGANLRDATTPTGYDVGGRNLGDEIRPVGYGTDIRGGADGPAYADPGAGNGGAGAGNGGAGNFDSQGIIDAIKECTQAVSDISFASMN